MIANVMAQSDGSSLAVASSSTAKSRPNAWCKCTQCVHLLSGQVRMSAPSGNRTAKIIRRLAPLIALFWLGLALWTNTQVPQLEKVAEAHNVALAAADAPSMIAMKHMGKVFKEFDSDSVGHDRAGGQTALGAEAHEYYDTLIQKLRQDTKHVTHVQDFWSDPLTAAGRRARTARPPMSRSTWRVIRAGAVRRIGADHPSTRGQDPCTGWRQGVRDRDVPAHRRPVRRRLKGFEKKSPSSRSG